MCEQENSSHPIQTAKPSSKNNKKREKKVQRIVLSIPFPLCSFMGFQTPITEVDRPNTIFHFCTFWLFFPLSQPVLPSCKLRRRKRPHGSQDAGDPRRGLNSKKNGMGEKGREGRGRERNRGRSNRQRGQEKKSLRVSRIGSNERSKKGEESRFGFTSKWFELRRKQRKRQDSDTTITGFNTGAVNNTGTGTIPVWYFPRIR